MQSIKKGTYMAINYEFTAAYMYLFLVPTQLQLTQMLYVFKCMKVPWTKTVISIWYTQDRWMLKRSMCQWPTSQHYLWFAQKNVGIPIICSHCNFLWSLQRSQHFNLHKQTRKACHTYHKRSLSSRDSMAMVMPTWGTRLVPATEPWLNFM